MDSVLRNNIDNDRLILFISESEVLLGVEVMEPLFEKVVILSGTSGVGIGDMLNRAMNLYGDEAAYAKYEDYVRFTGKFGIYTAASNLLWAPRSALDVFRRAFDAMVADLREKARGGARVAFIETHLSYISVHTLIPNPIIGSLIALGKETTILYYVDDFYHALYRIAKRIEQTPYLYIAENFVIDPLSYLMWRGLDHSLLIMLRAQYPNLETLMIGMKHPDETHNRVLQYAGLPTHKGRMRFLLAYISHPISGVRSDYYVLSNRGELSSIADHPFVKNFEAFKRKLRNRCKNLILFEPTTIDEILVPEGEEIEEYVVTLSNRWPHGRMNEYEEMYPVDIFDRELFGTLYGAVLAPLHKAEVKTKSILDYGGDVRKFYLNKLLGIIKDHIEVRDYEYVGQSSAIIVYEPIYKSIVTGSLSPSRGVRKELNRAESQSKAIYVAASGDTISHVAREASGVFGERINPIKLNDPSDPSQIIEILRQAELCN